MPGEGDRLLCEKDIHDAFRGKQPLASQAHKVREGSVQGGTAFQREWGYKQRGKCKNFKCGVFIFSQTEIGSRKQPGGLERALRSLCMPISGDEWVREKREKDDKFTKGPGPRDNSRLTTKSSREFKWGAPRKAGRECTPALREERVHGKKGEIVCPCKVFPLNLRDTQEKAAHVGELGNGGT